MSGVTECFGNFTDVTNATAARVWSNRWPNFDNTAQALMTCFVVAGLNGYTPIMDAAMAAPAEKGKQPRHMSNPGAFFWWVGLSGVEGRGLPSWRWLASVRTMWQAYLCL